MEKSVSDPSAGPLLKALLTPPPRVRPVDLAREAGVAPQYVYAVLASRKPASRKLLEAAVRLGLPVGHLLGTENGVGEADETRDEVGDADGAAGVVVAEGDESRGPGP